MTKRVESIANGIYFGRPLTDMPVKPLLAIRSVTDEAEIERLNTNTETGRLTYVHSGVFSDPRKKGINIIQAIQQGIVKSETFNESLTASIEHAEYHAPPLSLREKAGRREKELGNGLLRIILDPKSSSQVLCEKSTIRRAVSLPQILPAEQYASFVLLHVCGDRQTLRGIAFEDAINTEATKLVGTQLEFGVASLYPLARTSNSTQLII